MQLPEVGGETSLRMLAPCGVSFTFPRMANEQATVSALE